MSDRSDIPPRLILPAALVLPLLLGLRLPHALDGMDSVNFALALEEYDPGIEQPHFPGYPLYIFVCRLLFLSGIDAPLALALPGICASVLLAPMLRSVALRCGLTSRAAWIAVALLPLHPLLWSEGPRPSPDLLGTCLVWCAVACVSSRRAVPAGWLIGVAAGIRLDLAPFAALVGALNPGSRRPFLVALAGGLSLWVPLFLVSMPAEAVPVVAGFARGHFAIWGSSALGGAGTAESIRASVLLGGPGLPGLGLALLGLLQAPPALRRILGWGLAPYAAWVLVGQNLAHPRHFLPLLPAGLLLMAHAFSMLRRSSWQIGVAVGLVAAVVPLWLSALRPALDGRRLVSRAVSACGGCDAVYVGDTKRLFDHYGPPGFPVYRRSDLEGIRIDLEAWGLGGAEVLASSEIEGAGRLGAPVVELGGGLRLYRIDVAALR